MSQPRQPGEASFSKPAPEPQPAAPAAPAKPADKTAKE